MKNRLNESDIKRIISKVINEDVDRERMMEIVDDVVNRLKEHGMKYYLELNKLNHQYPTEKYKRLAPVKRKDVNLPKGVRVQSSYFPEDD
jgi:hypothetical protein